MDTAVTCAVSQFRNSASGEISRFLEIPRKGINLRKGSDMTENLNMTGNDMDIASSASIPEPTEAERREGAIRIVLFLLASSLVLPMLQYLLHLWQ
jgi:hypothetical protein